MNQTEYVRIRSCESKVTHFSRKEAKAHARAFSLRKKEKMYEYHCPHCTLWHIAHKASKQVPA